MLADKVRDLGFNGLSQQNTRPIAQDFGELVADVSWLNQFDDVIFGHGISLLQWRSGGVKHPHDMPPFRFLPSPTFGDSSRANGQAPDLQTPLFRAGSVPMRPDDGRVEDQIFEVWIIGHRFEDPPPNTLDAPAAEAPEHTVPIPECLRKIAPGRTRPHDPQDAFHEHSVVASSRTLLVRPTYDQRSHPLPSCVAQN